ncbi:hypothetical protein [Amycolatopsis plumensis]
MATASLGGGRGAADRARPLQPRTWAGARAGATVPAASLRAARK